MRVLVLPKNLEIGGTQVNAVDLSTRLSHDGHGIMIASTSGPLSERLDSAGVEVVEIPPTSSRGQRLTSLRRLVMRSEPDVIHAYETRNIMDAGLVSMSARTPILGTIMSTRVPWFLPETVPLTVGTPNLHEFTTRWRRGRTVLLEPPVPTIEPASTLPLEDFGLVGDGPLVVLVSRLVLPFKSEGILRAISSMHNLNADGFRLLIVGDGPARRFYERAAESTNVSVGRRAIALAGAMTNPAPAFVAADVVVGSGLSLLQGAMAGIPAVVLGRNGFSALLTSETIHDLIESGFYGVGDGLEKSDPLPDQIREAERTGQPSEAIGTELRAMYTVDVLAARLERELENAMAARPPTRLEMARSIGRWRLYGMRRRSLRREAEQAGLIAEEADNHVYGKLRDMALPPKRWGTGRNQRS